MLGKSNRDRYLFALALILVLIVVIPLFYLIGREIGLFGGGDEDSSDDDGSNLQVLEVEDTQTIDNLVLPDSYSIVTNLEGTPEGYSCFPLDQSGCITQIVSNGENTFYVSNPSELIFSAGPSALLTNRTLTLANGTEVIMVYEVLSIEDSSNQIVKQAYGCIDENTCVSSGFLDINVGTNGEQTRAFESFVSALTLK